MPKMFKKVPQIFYKQSLLLLDIFPSLPDQPETESSPTRLIGGYFAPVTAVQMSKPGCVICEYVLTEVDKILSNDKTEEAVEQELAQICTKLPRAIEDQCSHFVDMYGPALVKLIVHGLDPEEICSRLTLCEEDLLSQQASYPPQIALMKRNDDSCAMCTFAMEVILGFAHLFQSLFKNVFIFRRFLVFSMTQRIKRWSRMFSTLSAIIFPTP